MRLYKISVPRLMSSGSYDVYDSAVVAAMTECWHAFLPAHKRTVKKGMMA